MVENLISNITLIFRQVNYNALFLMKNKAFLFFSLFFIFLAIAIPIIFIPIMYGFPIVIQMSSLIPIGICFAALSYNWRKSTLYKNMMIGKNNKYNQNISVFITMYILCIALTITIMLIIFIASQFVGILLTDWMESTPAGDEVHSGFNLANFHWGMLFYTQSLNVAWMFAYCFFFQRIIKTEKGFYTSILALTIILFIMGGSFNDYFEGFTAGLLENPETSIPTWKKGAFPQSFYVVSLFIPLYATAQVIGGGVSNFWNDDYTSWVWYTQDISGKLFEFWNDPNTADTFKIGINGWAPWKWNILWFVPYIHIAIFAVLGILFSNLKQNKTD